MSEFREVWLPLIVITVAVLGGFATIFGGIDYLSCRGFANGTGIETRYEWGCYAKVNGKWVPKAYVFGSAHELRMK